VSYTQLALTGVVVTIALDLLVLRTAVLTRRTFWLSYAIIIVFQLVTNGVLTGFEIVRYDGSGIIGSEVTQFFSEGRIAFAPIEDLLFGFSLVVQSLAWWIWWGRRGVQRRPFAGPPRWRQLGGGAVRDG